MLNVQERYVQGVLTLGTQIWLSLSGDGGHPLEAGDTSSSRQSAYDFPEYGEDLHYSARTDNLWRLCEWKGKRFVYAVKAANVPP